MEPIKAHKRMRPLWRVPALGLAGAFAAAGCTGTAGSAPGAGSGGRSNGSGSGGHGSGGSGSTSSSGGGNGSCASSGGSGATSNPGSGGGAGVVAACPSAGITPTPLRRLTRFEYTNTVKDLLGVDPSAANELPADAETNGFDNQWVGTSRLDIITKSTTPFPSYSSDVRDAMEKELPAFVEYVLWSGDRTLNTLLTSPLAFITSPLAPIYGDSMPKQDVGTPQIVMTKPEQNRAGILTQSAVMAVQAHPDQTSPVLRGKFVRTNLLCQPPPPPPPDVNTTPRDVSAGGTARERFGAHLMAGSTCMGCHQLMDPIGFAFENYDAIGQYRTKDGTEDIDASGAILGSAAPALMGDFDGVKQLAGMLANSEQVRACVATQWFRSAAGRSEGDDDACSLSTLHGTFASSGGDLG